MIFARWFVVCVVVALALAPREASAADEVEAFARVVEKDGQSAKSE